MNKNTDLIQKLSEVDLSLVERVLQHLNYDDLEKRVAYTAYHMPHMICQDNFFSRGPETEEMLI